MFRFSRNHHQALSKKYKYPLHKSIKTRFGFPNVHNKHLVMIHTSLLTVIQLCSSAQPCTPEDGHNGARNMFSYSFINIS